MQNQGLDHNLPFQRRWLLLMLAVSLVVHGLFFLVPDFPGPEPESSRKRLVVGFMPQTHAPAVTSSTTSSVATKTIQPMAQPVLAPSVERLTAPPQQTKTTAQDSVSVPETIRVALPKKSLASQQPLTPPQQSEQQPLRSPSVTTIAVDVATPTASPLKGIEPATRDALATVPASSDRAAIDAPPAYLDNPNPIYPPLARQRGWQGDVLVQVSVDSHGKVVKTTLKQSSGHRVLDKSALKQVRTWQFSPALKGDMAVAGEVTVPIYFRLRRS